MSVVSEAFSPTAPRIPVYRGRQPQSDLAPPVYVLYSSQPETPFGFTPFTLASCTADGYQSNSLHDMRLSVLIFFLTLLVGAVPLAAQPGRAATSQGAVSGISPEIVEILGISVEGASDDYANSFIQQTSRLQVGQRLTLPGDPALGDAIRAIYRLRTYEDVQIVQERKVGQGVYLVIRVREVPKLKEYDFLGVKKGHAKDLRKEVPLVARGPVHENSIARSIQIIEQFYAEKGRPLANVNVTQTRHEDNTVTLAFNIDRGPKVKVKEIIINGNEGLSEGLS